MTGSGKTELYLRAAAEAIQRGRQAIILVPEIAITPQIVRRFLRRFPGQVGLIHSRLSEGERYDTWRRARLGLLKVIIGPRSALFAPLPDIGLIVADECHDGSYYQSDPPFYHAVEAIKIYARLCGAPCILGSATPTIQQRYQAESGESLRLELPIRIRTSDEPAEGGGLPPVSIVDMRAELKNGRRGIFSQTLVDGLEQVLKQGQQAILFLNRRGTATYVFCRQCGTVAKCPQCDTPLTYHVEDASSIASSQAGARSSGGDLRCHRCGYQPRHAGEMPSLPQRPDARLRAWQREGGDRGESSFPFGTHIALGLGDHPPEGCPRDHPEPLCRPPRRRSGWYADAGEGPRPAPGNPGGDRTG